MASISGNFNFPSDKGIPAKPKAIPASQETPALPTESVTLGGSGFAAPMVAGMAAQIVAENPSLTPAEVKEILVDTAKAGIVGGIASSLPQASRVPTTLSMDETSGIGAIGLSQGSEEGHGLTGLNSLASVVAEGRFQGLNGSYGPGNGLSAMPRGWDRR